MGSRRNLHTNCRPISFDQAWLLSAVLNHFIIIYLLLLLISRWSSSSLPCCYLPWKTPLVRYVHTLRPWYRASCDSRKRGSVQFEFEFELLAEAFYFRLSTFDFTTRKDWNFRLQPCVWSLLRSIWILATQTASGRLDSARLNTLTYHGSFQLV